MKVTLNRGSVHTTADKLEPGQICVIHNMGCCGEVGLRRYNSFISLENNEVLWVGTNMEEVRVELLPPGAKVTLEQES